MINLPSETLEACKKNCYDHYSPFTSIAFLVPSCNGSQQSLALIQGINEYIDTDPYTEWSIYTPNQDLPIQMPLFSIYHTNELFVYDGYLIISDAHAWAIAKKQCWRSKNIFYVYDIHEFNNIKPEIRVEIIKDSKAILARTPEHAKFLEKTYGIKILSSTIPYYNIDQIAKICEDLNVAIK